MRVLVTGGAGFIGSAFVRHVLAAHDDVQVTTVDALTYAGSVANLRAVEDDPRHTFVRGDVADPALVRRVMAGHDAVANFAAESHVDRSIGGDAAVVRTNVLGARAVFAAARDLGVDRCLHVSTDEVYGSIAPPRTVDEDAPLLPSSPYAASKAAADLLARSYRATHGVPILITRASNTFGPRQHPEKLIPRFATKLLRGLPVPLYGDGRNVRDWIHVDDNVRAQWLVLTEGEPGATYNVGGGCELSNREVTRLILAACGAGDEMVRPVPDRPGHDLRYAVDARRIGALGWRPRVDVERAIGDTVAWYREHPGWWRPLVAALEAEAADGAADAD